MQSPLKLFRSLKQGDPQSVAFTAVFVFLISVCWFSWTLLFPPKDKALPLGGNRFVKQIPDDTVSLSEILEVHRVFVTPDDVPNPFYREPPPERVPRAPANKTQPRNPRNQNPQNPAAPENRNTATDSTTPEVPPKEEPKTRPLTLSYRGLLTRPDQTTVALVMIVEENQQKFIRVGSVIPPFTVNQITPEGIQIQQERGPAIFLPRGETLKFEVPL